MKQGPDAGRPSQGKRRIKIAARSARDAGWQEAALEVASWRSDEPALCICDLDNGVGVLVVCLSDSWKAIRWEPGDDTEFQGAGLVFGALIGALYDGRRFRGCLLPVATEAIAAATARPPKGEDNWECRRRSERNLLRRLGADLAFEVTPADLGEDDPQVLPFDCWWCPKAALTRTVSLGWERGFEAYIAPRTDDGQLRELLVSDPRRALPGVLDYCHSVFCSEGEGQQMLILSKKLTLRHVQRAAKSVPVRRALRKLTKVARFTEWETVDRGPGWRWEQKK